MKKTSKIMSLVLAGAMVLSLGACSGGGTAETTKAELTEAVTAASSEEGTEAASEAGEGAGQTAEGTTYKIGILQLVQHTALDAANEGFIAALDEAGITVKDNMTMDEFIALCKEIREKTGYKTNIAYNNGENFIEYFLRANDVVMFEEGKLGGTAEDYVSYFKLYEEGIRDGWVVDPSIFAERTIGSVEQDPMVYGSNPETMSWCAFNYTNQLTAIRSAAPEGVEIAMTTWPSADPVKSDYLKPSQFFAVTKDSANPDEAAKVLNFITNSVECNEILLGERGIPLSSSVADSIAPKMDETSQEVIKFINEVVSDNSSQINPPAADGSSEVNDLLNKLEEQVQKLYQNALEQGKKLSKDSAQ